MERIFGSPLQFSSLFDFLRFSSICFRLNRQSYSQILSYYYDHVQPLEEENIAGYKYLKQGSFSSSLTGKPHSRIPFDQVRQMKINRSWKDVGGLSGNTQNPGATERWTKIHHHIVALREHLNKKIKKKAKERHVELSTTRIEREEEDVRNIITCIHAWLPEHWEKGHPITNFATGEIAMDDRKDGVIHLKKRGEIVRDEFVCNLHRITQN